jgi:hypothetical protein
MSGPAFFKGGELKTSSFVFIGNLNDDDQAHETGEVSARLSEITSRFISCFRVKFPNRPLDLACLDANVRVLREGTDAVSFTEFPLMGMCLLTFSLVLTNTC